jgi:hypothetical protein
LMKCDWYNSKNHMCDYVWFYNNVYS